jgi:hypothetical protein
MIIKYLSTKIIAGELEYSFVIGKRPDLKSGIDAYLIENGHGDLIS